jgi:hypothetical protein
MFLDIIHRPVYFSKHNVSETGFCLCVQVIPTQLGPIDRASPYLVSFNRFRGNVLKEPLSSNGKRLHIQTYRMMAEFMKYATEMGSGAMIYISSFITTASGIQNLMGG